MCNVMYSHGAIATTAILVHTIIIAVMKPQYSNRAAYI